jgi:hypothetical protein
VQVDEEEDMEKSPEGNIAFLKLLKVNCKNPGTITEGVYVFMKKKIITDKRFERVSLLKIEFCNPKIE